MNLFDDIKKQVSDKLNEKKVNFSKIEPEGSEIAIYTSDPSSFFENKTIVGEVAELLKKRINIRTDKNHLMDPLKALEIIQKIIPEDAGIKNIYFDSYFSEVVIEANKPGVVIGKQGDVSKSIIKQTKWIPKIIRAPSAPSEVLKKIRNIYLKNGSERKQFLKDVAYRIYTPLVSQKDWVRVTALGGFREVGRSSILLETPDTKILLDCGINPADKNEEVPYLGVMRFPLDELDAVVITHAHMDHIGFLPYLFKAGYKGPVYCTEPTRDLMGLLLFDAIDVSLKTGREPLFSEEHVKETLKHCIVRNFREVTDIAPGIRLTFHGSSHILGSASAHLHIGEGKQNLVYSGDIKYGFTRLFNNMDINYPRLETLILESTYGGKPEMPSRVKSEADLINIINETVDKKGITLIPVFSVGRAQEVMLVLEDFYRRGVLKTTNIFIDGMTREASAIHTVYPEYLKQNIKTRILQNNSPFMSKIFRPVDYDDNSRENVLKTEGAVILASAGMLTGGPSLGYLYELAENPNNSLIFVGYQAKNSLGYKIQKGLKSMPISDDKGRTKTLNINLRIEIVDAYSGHSFRQELLNYIQHLNPKPRTILVNHGDSCPEFSRFINKKFHINTASIQNLESVRLR
ncbi:MAG: beta-CASP ribonuclease aCPSF1 [Candidatus ainarchaeum sp.]|nr:beta-CASP ribonuclease aCPSF1 [Candidatus ainarchaeum sp.]